MKKIDVVEQCDNYEWVHFTNKKWRAPVIVDYARNHYYQGIVCFSIGSSDDLKRNLMRTGLNIIHISPEGDLQTNRWWTQDEIELAFPNYVDATSGHLPIHLLNKIAMLMRSENFLFTKEKHYVPTGSGESFICYCLAYPKVNFVPVYNLDKFTQHNPDAPLNSLVVSLASEIHMTLPEGVLSLQDKRQLNEKNRVSKLLEGRPAGTG